MEPFTNSGRGTHQVVEFLHLGDFPIVLYFDADEKGKAISDIKNSYFHKMDEKELYNELGSTIFKKYLLNKIKQDLSIRKTNEKWAELAYEKYEQGKQR